MSTKQQQKGQQPTSKATVEELRQMDELFDHIPEYDPLEDAPPEHINRSEFTEKFLLKSEKELAQFSAHLGEIVKSLENQRRARDREAWARGECIRDLARMGL